MQNNQKNQLKLDCRLSKEEIYNFLYKCNDHFPVDLSSLVNLLEYSEKLSKLSAQTCYYVGEDLVGILVYYTNNKDGTAFIPIIGILKEYQSKGIGTALLLDTMNFLSQNGLNLLRLAVHKVNPKSLNLFLKYGFDIVDESKDQYVIEKDLTISENHSTSNDL